MTTAKQKLLDLLDKQKPFSEKIQKVLGRDRAIVYCVNLLENEEIKPTFQRICVAASKLFPESFSLYPEFPEFPDSRTVRNCLWHCTHESKGWLSGSDKTYYSLTEESNKIIILMTKVLKKDYPIEKLPLRIEKGLRLNTTKEKVTKITDTDQTLIDEIKKSKAYHKFLNNEEIKIIELIKSIGGTRNSPKSLIAKKLSSSLKASKILKERRIEQYLQSIKKRIMEEY